MTAYSYFVIFICFITGAKPTNTLKKRRSLPSRKEKFITLKIEKKKEVAQPRTPKKKVELIKLKSFNLKVIG